jgi:hypothetical protein
MYITHTLELSNKIARAAGMDKANQFMRESGKKGKPWTREAYNVAVRERNRIMDALYPGEGR